MATSTKSSRQKKSAAKELSLNRVERVILYVKDTLKSVHFYNKTLGIPVRFAEDGWAELDTKGVNLSLHGGRPSGVSPTCSSVCFHVGDVDAAYSALKAAKVPGLGKIESPCAGTRYVCFSDPDGNALSIEGR